MLLQLRIGGQAARHLDETIPLRCGCVGQETTGAGVSPRLCERCRSCWTSPRRYGGAPRPEAWIIDFTNPVGIVTRSLLDRNQRAIGLCNVAIGFQLLFASWLGVDATAVHLGHAGLNHLTWIRSVEVSGEDVLPRLIEEHGEQLASRVGMPLRLLRSLGAIPSYYLRYFYQHDVVVGEQRGQRTRAEEVMDIERQLLEIYRDPPSTPSPSCSSRRGGAFYSEAAVQLLASLSNDTAMCRSSMCATTEHCPNCPTMRSSRSPCTINRAGADTSCLVRT